MKSFLFNSLFILWTTTLGLVASPSLLLPKGHKFFFSLAKIWAGVTLLLLEKICKIGVRIEGKLPSKVPFLVASKHQSAWETIFFLTLLPRPAFVLKEELTRIPIYGWYLKKLGMLIINRKAGMQAIKKLKKEAKIILQSERPLVIFPEGTRTKPGQRVAYKSGVKILAEEYKLPVVPISLDSGFYWNNKKPGVITVTIRPVFKAQKDFLKELEEIIEN